MKVFIYAEGGVPIGLGHIVRTLSLAKCMRQRGHEVFYVTSQPEGCQKVMSEGFEIWPPHPGTEQASEFGVGLSSEDSSPDICIVDRYDVTPVFFAELRKTCPYIVYIDDLNQFDYAADVILNGTASARDEDYQWQSHVSKLLLGLKYNLVDKRFCIGSGRKYSSKAWRVLITMGGTDSENATGSLLLKLKKCPLYTEFLFEVAVGRNFPFKSVLLDEFSEEEQVRFYVDNTDLLPLMQECDFAISAGGITLYELIAAGIPAASVITAPNQRMQVNALNEEEIMPTLGEFNEISEDHLNSVMNSIHTGYKSWTSRACMACSIIDGNGAGRVVDIITKGEKQHG